MVYALRSYTFQKGYKMIYLHLQQAVALRAQLKHLGFIKQSNQFNVKALALCYQLGVHNALKGGTK
jgi:hypothetical protein